MKKLLTFLQYGISFILLLWGIIDCSIQLIELASHPGWSAPLYTPLLWFLAFYFIPAVVIFLVFTLIKRFIK